MPILKHQYMVMKYLKLDYTSFYRTEHRILLPLLYISIMSIKEHAYGVLLIHSSVVLQS